MVGCIPPKTKSNLQKREIYKRPDTSVKGASKRKKGVKKGENVVKRGEKWKREEKSAKKKKKSTAIFSQEGLLFLAYLGVVHQLTRL